MRLANSGSCEAAVSGAPASLSGSTQTAASSSSRTVVKRSCAAASSSRTRLGSVMSVIEVIHPVWRPSLSTSGETYMRESKVVPSLRRILASKPLGGDSPRRIACRLAWWRVMSSSGQYGKGASAPISSSAVKPSISQNARLT